MSRQPFCSFYRIILSVVMVDLRLRGQEPSLDLERWSG
jgi:hypothetical protein